MKKQPNELANPLSAKLIKWSNTLKQIVGKLPTICLSVFDHFSGLALKGLSLVLFVFQTMILDDSVDKNTAVTANLKPINL